MTRRDAPPPFVLERLAELYAATEAWRPEAACRDRRTDAFYPGQGQSRSIRAAKAICRRCTVREQCLDFALRTREKHGVWGGLSEQERRRIRVRMFLDDVA